MIAIFSDAFVDEMLEGQSNSLVVDALRRPGILKSEDDEYQAGSPSLTPGYVHLKDGHVVQVTTLITFFNVLF